MVVKEPDAFPHGDGEIPEPAIHAEDAAAAHRLEFDRIGHDRPADGTEGADQAWIVSTVRRFADQAGIGMPEVGIFEGEPNAFATGAFKNSALVAVSTGLLQGMTREEVEAVIGHEVAHIANGDMVTMTLIQGVMNTFVVFLSRAVGYAVTASSRAAATARARASAIT